ncbi:putative carboxylesterase [Helianthus annuus]|nr:putative carboxylesterase [Helianthus annuus]
MLTSFFNNYQKRIYVMSHSIIFHKKNTQQIQKKDQQNHFLGSIDVIQDAYQAIADLTSAYEISTGRSGNKILAFNCSPEYTSRFLRGEFNFISSEKLPLIDFISTKVNSSFLINEAAVELFQHIGADLKELENKHINTSLIITGSGLGGYIAILSTLRLHDAIDVEEANGSKKTKRPICITFGSPFIGDINLQRAIEERLQLKLSYLNVVAKEDPVASFFSSNTPYKPLGTSLFCTESGGHAAFEDQDLILQALDAMKLRNAGITFQLKEVGVLDDVTSDEIGRMEKKRIEMIRRKNVRQAYDPSKKLNDMKISLTYMEWYMKGARMNVDYYDMYRYPKTFHEINQQQIVMRHQHRLNHYWKKTVEENYRMPQIEGAKLRNRWISGATNYRRIVEPLDIALYYDRGNQNYIKHRPNHYKLLEKWLVEDKKNSKSSEEIRHKAASLTEDSCFWAYVEEALISLRDLVNEGLFDTEQKLEEFEAYVMRLIENYSVSPDIFLEGSSFMKWWNEYKAEKGTAYASELAQYMNTESYKSYH